MPGPFVAGFFVAGEPKTKGSWRGWPMRDSGAPCRACGLGPYKRTAKGGPRIVMKQDCDDEADWVAVIKLAAENWKPAHPLAEPFKVRLLFYTPRPDSTKYPEYPQGWSDIDKLERSVLDALNGVIWEDDKHVIEVEKKKCYARREELNPEGLAGIFISIRSLSKQATLF